MRRRWLVAAVAASSAALGACTSPGAGTTSAPATSGVRGPLTGKEMAAIVTATMATNNRANSSLDLRLLESYEAGSALAIDAASYAEAAKAAASDCSFAPFDMAVLETVALGDSAYPRRFVALGSSRPLPPPAGCPTASNPCPHADSLFEFEQAAPGASWKIVLEPSAGAGRVVDFSTGAPAGAAPAGVAAARRLPAAVAAALGTYEATGRLGRLQASDFSSSCWLIPNPRAAYEEDLKGGVTLRQIYSPAPDEAAVPISGGHALGLFTLLFVTTLVPRTPDGVIDWVSDAAADPVTGLLASGAYSRIVEDGSVEVAAETAGTGAFRIIGAYSGVTSVTGTAGSAPHGSGGGGILVSEVEPSSRAPAALSRR
ncbi:MAG: hypothetical protein ACLQNG_07710 [Acidimicrobiales bacterium]